MKIRWRKVIGWAIVFKTIDCAISFLQGKPLSDGDIPLLISAAFVLGINLVIKSDKNGRND